jgi:endonuclease I
MLKRQLVSISVLLFLCIFLSAQIPANYYSKAIGKQSAELKTVLYEIVKPHKSLDYGNLNNTFRTTDWHPDGYFWDMYSTYKRSYWSGMNREHSMPKSWFGVNYGAENEQPIGCDVHNLFPSDANINSEKSNYALGVASSSSYLSNSLCKVGKSTYPGYSGTVFEPANEYKGDFARGYMYMVTCYENYANTWQSTGTSSMLQRNTYPVFNTYAVNLLMEWHRADPVSSKEINRNDSVYSLQKNRNPFIDHPLLAEYLWGEFVGESWDGTSVGPETDSPLIFEYHPENQTVFVQLQKPADAIFAIYSLSGELKQNGNVDGSSLITLKDMNTQKNYEKGVYILSVYAGEFRKTVKLMVY